MANFFGHLLEPGSVLSTSYMLTYLILAAISFKDEALRYNEVESLSPGQALNK